MVLKKTPRYAVFAVAISYLSIGASVAELALFLTAYDLSLSLYGVALMAITDISGDLLILTQWQGRVDESSYTSSRELREARASQKLMEVWASFTVGIFLFICALFLLADSIKSVVVASRQSAGTDQLGLGMAASVVGVICSSLLAAYKFKIARELESSTVLANAISSQCSAMTSAAAIFAALLDAFWSSLDSVLGSVVAAYTLYQGVTIMMSARADLRDLRDDRLHRHIHMLHQQQSYHQFNMSMSTSTTPMKRVRFEDDADLSFLSSLHGTTQQLASEEEGLIVPDGHRSSAIASSGSGDSYTSGSDESAVEVTVAPHKTDD